MRLHPIEALVRAEKWVAARKAIEKALVSRPDDHWLLTRLGLTYYELGDYSTALSHEKRALAIAPKCPLVLWDYAGTLQMLGRHREAIDVYRTLVRRGPKRIAKGPCGEGLARARGLVADCHYRVADSLHALNRRKEALVECDAHLKMRGPGCQSIYKLGQLAKFERARRNRRASA